MTVAIFRRRIIRENATSVFIQGKKILLPLERWAEEKRLQFCPAQPCRAGWPKLQPQPLGVLPATLLPAPQPFSSLNTATSREIPAEAQISAPLAFHFSLPGECLLVVLKGNSEPAETGTWLPKDFLGDVDMSGFSLVSQIFCKPLFGSSFPVNFTVKRNVAFQWRPDAAPTGVAWWCVLIWGFISLIENLREWLGSAACPGRICLLVLLQLHHWWGTLDWKSSKWAARLLETQLAREETRRVATRKNDLGTPIAKVSSLVEAAGRECLVPAGWWQEQRKKSEVRSMDASATLRPQSGFLLNADQTIDELEEEEQCISCSLHQLQLTLLSAQPNTSVLRKIWHRGLLDDGRRGSFASAVMLCSSPTALQSLLQPGRQSLEGFQHFTHA